MSPKRLEAIVSNASSSWNCLIASPFDVWMMSNWPERSALERLSMSTATAALDGVEVRQLLTGDAVRAPPVVLVADSLNELPLPGVYESKLNAPRPTGFGGSPVAGVAASAAS